MVTKIASTTIRREHIFGFQIKEYQIKESE